MTTEIASTDYESPRVPASPRQLLINGEFVDSATGATFPTLDPANGARLAEVAEAGPVDVDRAVAAARAAFEGVWQMTSPAARSEILWRVSDLIERHADGLALVDCLDNGKPIRLTRQRDVPGAIAVFRYYAGWATKINGRTVVPSKPGDWHAFTYREPVGVVGSIIPWNSPLNMAAWKLAPALAAGNTVVLKPAEQTPLSALWLGQLLLEAGLPEGVVNILPGFGAVAGAAIAAHRGIDKVAFTGSAATGRLILNAAGGNLKRVSLELGGKSPNIVFPDADIDAAIAGGAEAIFTNQGQVCIAGSRLYAHKRVFDDVVHGVAERARSLRIGPGSRPDTELGPVVSDQQLQQVLGYLAQGAEDGARTLAGGKRHGTDGFYVEPTVVVDVPQHSTLLREEIFGPVLAAFDFDDVDEVVAQANDTRYGLGAGVWTKDISTAFRVAKKLQAGTVFVNNYFAGDPDLPFGGWKESGWGRDLGPECLEQYTETKSVIVKL
jgi:phenylacetaldehyde dehydrogenase